MSVATALTRCLNLAHPIIQAPLAGGGDTPELVAAASNAGALGFIGAAYSRLHTKSSPLRLQSPG